jgi:Na+:H+ antiporter, NhaA family
LSLEHWINDGLMAVFFLLVGLEIKRELVVGELASWRQAALPVVAALGGMIAPALIYASINWGGDAMSGWAIPMATDIAFAVGVLALVGKGLSPAIKVLLLAIAIVDDLGAVIVIALFYTAHVSMLALGVAALFLAALILLNAVRVRNLLPYLLLGVGLWAAMLASGIHATIAGVLLAFTIPVSVAGRMQRTIPLLEAEESQAHDAAAPASHANESPLVRLEHALIRPVSFLILPLFALANAGVDLRGGLGEALSDRVMWGVTLGLLLGKPIGILAASMFAVKCRIASLPTGLTPQRFLGVALLCGIGFTMSLFLTNLAFPNDEGHRAASKLAIMGASVLAGVIGAITILTCRSRDAVTPDATPST